MRLLLYPFALLMLAVVSMRNMFYNKGVFKSRSFAKPIICVGNLSVGGTGKSPIVIYLAKLLSTHLKVATLSRGYGRKTTGFRQVSISDNTTHVGDEPLMFANELPAVNVFVGEDRCAAIDTILGNHPSTQTIILDDAMQHRKVKAGLYILLTRFSDPFWHDHLLPAGNLREPANSAARAQLVVITNCPSSMSDSDRSAIRKKAIKYTSAEVFFSTVKYQTPHDLFGVNTWKGKYDSLLCVSGIANPTAFHQHASAYAVHTQNMVYSDHHEFSEKDLKNIKKNFDSLSGEKAILVTAKDKVRLAASPSCLNMLNEIKAVFYQPIEFSILDDPKRFDQLILQYAQTHS
ncbi:MAG: tetraacyldisaccharide 4'-kinase [Flavobacteriales bacterium]